MKTIKKITRGRFKGYNIRQTKDGKYHAYIGTVCQSFRGFDTVKECEDWIKTPNFIV